VLVDGLESKAARGYNGQIGRVTGYNHVKARYAVTLDASGKAVSLRRGNLTVVALPADVDADRATALKSDGNNHIQKQEYAAAIRCYTQALAAAGAPAAGGACMTHPCMPDSAGSGGPVDPLWVVLLSNRVRQLHII